MHGYKEFKNDVLTIFREEINKHSLICVSKLEDEISEKVCYAKLYNEDFEIEFSLDRMDLYVEIINPKIEISFDFNQVFSYLYPEETLHKFNGCEENKRQTRDYIKCQLSYYYNVLNKYLQSLVFGNFEWALDFEKIENDKKIILGKIRKLGYSHTLYQLALVKGENDWYEKAKEYFGSGINGNGIK